MILKAMTSFLTVKGAFIIHNLNIVKIMSQSQYRKNNVQSCRSYRSAKHKTSLAIDLPDLTPRKKPRGGFKS